MDSPDHPPQGAPTSQTPLHLGVGDTDTVSRWQGPFCEGKIRSLSLLLRWESGMPWSLLILQTVMEAKRLNRTVEVLKKLEHPWSLL